MPKLTQTVRFAFGHRESPASAVWRASANGKAGDIFLQNVAQLASSIHVALHASGRFSLKLGSRQREPLQPPMRMGSIFVGPVIFYQALPRAAPSLEPTGNTHLVNWLGVPGAGSLFMVKTLYTQPDSGVGLGFGETQVGHPLSCRLFHKPMSFHLVLQHRALTSADGFHFEELDFGGNNPDSAELIRVAKTAEGPSAIIHDGFRFKNPPVRI